MKSDVRVCTYHYDNQRLGWNPREDTLTPASVSSPGFGKLWHNPLDGLVHGAPLVLDGRVFVVTDANSAFALDVTTGKIVWERRNLLPTLTAGQFNGSWNSPERHGVLSTPVIDPVAGVLYFCAPRAVRLKQVYEVHALDIKTGASVPGWPVALSAHYKKAVFTAGQVMQRGALTLAGGRLYVPFGGRGDIPPWRGWVIGLDVKNPRAPQKAFCFSPVTDGAGVWSAGGVSIDAQGRVYAVTGNGDYDLPEGGENFGQSIVRLAPDLTFSGKPADFFTPENYRFLDEQDEDLGGATCLILPTKDPLLFTGGKDGCAYLLSQSALGGLGGKRGGLRQRTRLFCDEKATYHEGIRATAAYFAPDGGAPMLFVPGDNPGPDKNLGLVALTLTGSGFTKAWTLPRSINRPSAPVVTSQGGKEGIVWLVEAAEFPGQPSALLAFDALTGRQLFASGNGPDQLLAGRKFTGPSVANGAAFVGAAGVFCYGVQS